MSFSLPPALAAGPAPGEPNPLITIAMFAGLFLFMYLVVIRPQRKRQKEHRALIAALSKGDEVVTNSGILGKITKIDDNFVALEVSDKVELKFQRAAVHAVLPKGTIKAI